MAENAKAVFVVDDASVQGCRCVSLVHEFEPNFPFRKRAGPKRQGVGRAQKIVSRNWKSAA